MGFGFYSASVAEYPLGISGFKGFFRQESEVYARSFAEMFPAGQIVQTLSAQLSWSHVVLPLDKMKDPEVWKWYAAQTGGHGWSVRVLDHQIATNLFSRQVTTRKRLLSCVFPGPPVNK